MYLPVERRPHCLPGSAPKGAGPAATDVSVVCVSPGCTLWSAAGISADSRPNGSDRRRCVVSSGATSHAVCCHAPSLECHLLEKISADKDQVHILFRPI